MAGGRGAAEVKTLIPPWTFIPLITSANGGAINLISGDWVSPMPSSDFCLSLRILLGKSISSTPDFISIYNGTTNLNYYWVYVLHDAMQIHQKFCSCFQRRLDVVSFCANERWKLTMRNTHSQSRGSKSTMSNIFFTRLNLSDYRSSA